MNQINPKKLLRSKWTALNPQGKAKHFMVTRVEFDEQAVVTRCVLEAVLNRKLREIDWRDLKDDNEWAHGWK